jgi:hypothetical protein
MATPTDERTAVLKDLAKKIKATKDPRVAAKLITQYLKLDKKNTPAHRPKLVPDALPEWLESDLFPMDWPNGEPITAIKAANEIIKAPGFWTLGPDGERWGPEMRKQGRRFGSITASGQDTGIWEETGIVLEEVMRKKAF